jgi:Icc-related predicted phosphoesterase
VLLISDVECPALWDYYQPSRVVGVDLILSCGDLKKEYLEFLVTMTGKPVLYIPGNHDKGYVTRPPEGCENIDGEVFTYRGVRFAGLGGCKWYTEGPYQYTERQMEKRVKKLQRRIKKAHGVDVFVTHAGMEGYGDADDAAHRGFACFRELLDRWHPQYYCHGHVHRSYGWDIPRMVNYGEIPVVNAFERYLIDVKEP